MEDESWKEIFNSIWQSEGKEFISILLDAGVDTKSLKNNGKTLLSYAAEWGNHEMVEFLVQNTTCTACTHKRDMEDVSWKEIFNSIWQSEGRNDFIQILLDAGLDINSWKNKGKTVLSYAAKWGNLEMVKFLIEKGGDCDGTNSDGSKALHIAAEYGHKDIVELFLEFGVFVDSCDNDKYTSLHYIAERSNYPDAGVERYMELIHFLVAKGANLNAVDGEGRTPMLLAAEESREAIVELFMNLGADVKWRDDDDYTVLHHASESGFLGIVRSLMERRADIDINAKASNRFTPLILAAEASHQNIVELLLEYGVNTECRGHGDLSLLHFASENGWLNIVKDLVNRGCDINAKTYSKETPLILATKSSHSDIAVHLIESGAEFECCDEDHEQTALHYACEYGSLDVVKSLLQKGCNINVQNLYGSTPLHMAVFRCHLDIIENLIKKGADFNIEDRFCKTALNSLLSANSIARRKKIRDKVKVIKLFLENGAHLHSMQYDKINSNSLLKEAVLQDTELCTHSVINCFNNVDLPSIYKIPLAAESLPPIEQLKIIPGGVVAQDIANSVQLQIDTKGYCNILDVHPISLNVLCVRSFVGYYESLEGKYNIIAKNSTINSAKKLRVLRNKK